MRNFVLIASVFGAAWGLQPTTALGDGYRQGRQSGAPATVACLGSLDELLTCGEGARLVDQRDDSGGAAYCAGAPAPGGWPPAVRSGPSLWFHFDVPQAVSRAGNYVNHDKHGRHYKFDRQGRLRSIVDYKNDDYHGMMIECHENGAVRAIMPWTDGELHGLVRRWDADGRVKSVSRYDRGRYHGRVEDGSVATPPPADACRPRTCDLDARPGQL